MGWPTLRQGLGAAFAALGCALPAQGQSPLTLEQQFPDRVFDYKKHGRPLQDLPTAQHARAVHLELGPHEGITEPIHYLVRHAEAAAYMLKHSADEYSGRSIQVSALEANIFQPCDPANTAAGNRIICNVLSTADVVTVSMAAYEPLLRAQDFSRYEAQWAGSPTMVFQAAGNHGHKHCDNLEAGPDTYEEATHLQFARNHFVIGTAERNSDGKIYAAADSACRRVDFVGLNPYPHKNMDYKIYPTSQEYVAHVRQALPQTSSSDQNLSDMLAERRTRLLVDADNFAKGIEGNSFIAPDIGAAFAAAKEKNPALAPELLGLIAMISSNPVEQSAYIKRVRVGGTIYNPQLRLSEEMHPTQARNNGSGLIYDDKKTGFGFLDIPRFLANTAQATQAGQSQTTQSISSIPVGETLLPDNRISYKFRLDQPLLAYSTHFVAEHANGSYPGTMILRSPQGAEFHLLPALTQNAKPGSPVLLAMTHAFAGANIKGEWELIASKGTQLKEIRLTHTGFAPGGAAEWALKNLRSAPAAP